MTKLGNNREWKDPTWTQIPALRRGLTTAESITRATLFGANAIEVASRGVFALLVDEVLHPFYIFQVLSIALWSFDNYYCESSVFFLKDSLKLMFDFQLKKDYAFAIALISIVSIITTLIETRNVC